MVSSDLAAKHDRRLFARSRESGGIIFCDRKTGRRRFVSRDNRRRRYGIPPRRLWDHFRSQYLNGAGARISCIDFATCSQLRLAHHKPLTMHESYTLPRSVSKISSQLSVTNCENLTKAEASKNGNAPQGRVYAVSG